MKLVKKHICAPCFLFIGVITASTSFANTPYVPLFDAADLAVSRAGSAAIVQDASTNYTNPAGIALFTNPKLTISGIGVITPARFTGTATSPGFGSYYSQTAGSSTRAAGVVPTFFYSRPLSERWAAGIAVTTPYAFGANYGTDSVVRYEIIYGKQMSLDIGPNIAYKINSQWSIGGGPDLLYYYAGSKSAMRTQPFTTSDTYTVSQLTALRPGYHFGVLFEMTQQSRIGVSYHSQIIMPLNGSSTLYMGDNSFIAPPVTHVTNYKVKLPLAGVFTLSGYHALNPRWAILGTIEYMNWGIYQYDHVQNAVTPVGVIDAVAPRTFQNTFTYALGGTYKYNDKWLWRAGTNYYPQNVSGSNKDVTFTNAINISLSCGAKYQVNRQVSIDMAYDHGFTRTVNLHHTYAFSGNTISGRKSSNTNALGVQMNYDFV